MKRTATLLAGLLLVTGTVFAEGVQVTAAHVEGTYWLTNSQKGSLASEGGDLDLEVKVEKAGKFGTLGLVLQNDKDDDTDLRVTYTKTEGDWTVATEALLVDSNGDLLGQTGVGAAGANMNKGDGTYISWDVMGSKMFKLTYFPYEVGGMSWDEETLETFKGFGMPGMKLDVKVNANTSVALKLATDNGDSNAENEYAYKAELNTKVGKASIKAAAGVGTVTGSETWSVYNGNGTYLDLELDADGNLNYLDTDGTFTQYTSSTKTEKTVLAAQLKMPIAKFDVLAEANMETAEFSYNTVKVGETDTTAFYLKGSYNMGTYNKYGVTPYASMEVTKVELKPVAGESTKNTVTDLEAGVELKQGSFTVTPKVVMNKSSDAKIYDKEDGDAKKTATAVGVKFAYAM